MSKAIIVEAKGKKITGVVADETEVNLASKQIIDETISNGMDELVAILGGEITDPSKKRCSRCVKIGRVPYHNLEDFSLLKNGKRHSQCKVCRVELSDEWCKKRAEHRKEYHREYHKSRPQRVVTPKGVQALMDVYKAEEEGAKRDASEALFVGFPTVDVDIPETD